MKTIKTIFHQSRRFLAKFWLGFNPNLLQIAVSGSFGKTNTARAIDQVLSQKFKGVMTDLDLDTIYNVPLTALKVRPWHHFAVFELGVDKKKEMLFHLELVKPTIGVLTGITPVHADKEHFGSLEAIISEKGHLLEALPKEGVAILNFDDGDVRAMASKTKSRIIWYGTDKKNCHFWPEKIGSSLEGLIFVMNTPVGKIKVLTQLLGKQHVYTCMAAAAVAWEAGLSLDKIRAGLEQLKPLKGRLSLEKGPKETLLINDSLRANPASTIAGLEFLKEIKGERRKIAVLGEMGELGRYRLEAHKRIGKVAAKAGLDYLVSVGPLQKYTAQAAVKLGMAKTKVFWVKDVREAALVLEGILKRGDLWYLKGSLLRHLERILILLEGGKVNCQKISCHNYNPCSSCPRLLE